MSEESEPGDVIRTTIVGDVSGSQIAAGRSVQQTMTVVPAEVIGEEGLAELRAAFAALRSQVEAEAPAEKRDEALELVTELEGAVTSGTPDLSTMEYVRNWFVRNVPRVAGAVVSVVLHPLVGRLVEAGGDTLVTEFRSRFGGG